MHQTLSVLLLSALFLLVNAGEAYAQRPARRASDVIAALESMKTANQRRTDLRHADTGASFGTAVAIAGGRVYVGAPGDKDRAGRVHVFDLSGKLVQSIDAPKPAPDAIFGSEVVASADHVAISAPQGNEYSGAIHVFNARTLKLERTLTLGSMPKEKAPGPVPQDFSFLGTALAMHGDQVAALAWAWDNESPSIIAGFDADEQHPSGIVMPDPSNARALVAIARTDKHFVFGMTGAQNKLPGVVMVVDAKISNPGAGKREPLLLARSGKIDSSFGIAVAAAGGRVLVGSPGSTQAYLFDANTGEQLAILKPSSAQGITRFGTRVALNEHFAAVSAWLAAGEGMGQPVAFIYPLRSGNMGSREEVARLVGTEKIKSEALFGVPVAIDGRHAVLGYPGGEPAMVHLFELMIAN